MREEGSRCTCQPHRGATVVAFDVLDVVQPRAPDDPSLPPGIRPGSFRDETG